MRIDITSPDGNTLAALGIATNLLKCSGASKDAIAILRQSVLGARDVHAARRAITRATKGGITFYDPREEE